MDCRNAIFNQWTEATIHLKKARCLVKSKIRGALDELFNENQNLISVTVKLIPTNKKFSCRVSFELNGFGVLTRSPKQISKLLKKDFDDETHVIALEIFESNPFITVSREDLRFHQMPL